MDYFISSNLKFLRKINELSQEELADIVNYSFRTISKWETGESIPSYDNLQALSKTFNVSIDDLMKKDLSSIKDFHKFSSKLVDNKNNFLLFQKEFYKYLFVKSNDEVLRDIIYKNSTIVPYEYQFSDRITTLLKKEKLSFDKAKYILDKALNEMRKNSLVDYYDIIEVKDVKFIIKYKISL